VEILIRLLETDEFINNTIRTSWLDDLIAKHFQTERPDIILSVICAALHIADETFRTSFQNFRSSLERYSTFLFLFRKIKCLFLADKFCQ